VEFAIESISRTLLGRQFTFLDGHAQRYGVNAYWDLAANKALTNNAELLWLPD